MDIDALEAMSNARAYRMDLRPDAPRALAPGSPLPVLFISHGSPTSVVHNTPLTRFWQKLGQQVLELPGIQSVLIISAHWETPGGIQVNTASNPPTIYDYYGFPPKFYKAKYPAKGSQALSSRAVELLQAAGIPVSSDPQHGLDHGAWVPLLRMLPDCPLPVVQLSLRLDASAADHIEAGQALQPLRREGVLIVGSGTSVHNLADIGKHMTTDEVAPYVEPFDQALEDAVCSGDAGTRNERLIGLERHRLFRKAHPTAEHLYPLYVAAGAAGSDQCRSIFRMAELSIGNSSFVFGSGI